ncbi:MAG: cellulase family glycosylhydrolase [Planctomycetaceae bacterium]
MYKLSGIALFLVVAATASAADLEWIEVAPQGDGFIHVESKHPFVPWGFNYDHEGDGALLEDYWNDKWPVVEEAFSEMKALGANVVRIHLQFGRFMKSPTEPDADALEKLQQLLRLAEETGLYLDVTGLGCYHKQDVPPWYDELEEQARWEAQAVFWEAVAKTCSASPAVFCYDLMNEPVVPGGDKKRDDWLGPGFGGKHFVQVISLDRTGRNRAEIARAWIQTLVVAVRKHDKRHLITVGLVPWSLDRPGLTSGFDPVKIADQLDFIAFHLYPEKGKLDEALDTLKGFAAAGKPVVIEEMFTLKCGADELGEFIDASQGTANGWIGFYWGQTPDELREANTIPAAITLSWLELFQEKGPQVTSPYHAVSCEGTYPHHLQGVCVDESHIYWSFTTTLVKTDLAGHVLSKIPVANHHGDLCFHDGKLYVAVNLGKFNDPNGNADSWVYVYDAQTLKELARHQTAEVFHGAGGIGFANEHFFVVGGLPDGFQENYVYEYDRQFKFLKKRVVPSGHTLLGIQTATFANDQWWFGCYGNPKILLVTDDKFQMQGRYEFDCSLGIVPLPGNRFFVASGRCEPGKGCTGRLDVALPSEKSGLQIMPPKTLP